MLATQMPPPASHSRLPSLSSSSGPEGSTSLPIMSPAVPSQHTHSSSTVPVPAPHSHSPSMTCGLTSNATSRPSGLSRPKLTLQTSSLPVTFGSSSTGLSLSLAAGSTASPTVRNTFKNAYDMAYPSSATASPSRASSSNNRFAKPASPFTSSNPYQLPLGVKSILRNSQLESSKRRSSITASGPNDFSTSRRVYFPTKKHVSYRNPLEEEIKTVKYTARHSDIVSESENESCETSSDDESDYSTSSLVSSETTPSDDEENTAESTLDKKKKKRKYRSHERQVRAVALMEGLQDPYNPTSLTPQSPLQGRFKRRREWRWTLGPLEEVGSTPDASGSQTGIESEQDSEPGIKLETPSTTIPLLSAPKPTRQSPISPASNDPSKPNTALSSAPSDPQPQPPLN
ncbi:hypothetical protein BDV18DRAFT_99160 [Aspergillus unguis]